MRKQDVKSSTISANETHMEKNALKPEKTSCKQSVFSSQLYGASGKFTEPLKMAHDPATQDEDRSDPSPYLSSSLVHSPLIADATTMTMLEDLELQEIQGATRQIQSIADLQSMLTEHLEEQSLTIDTIFEDAVTSMDHVGRGLEYLKGANKHSEGPYKMGAIFLIVLALSLVFFDLID